jgi:hypothetical protein
MHDHPNRSVADEERGDDFSVLGLLLRDDPSRPWSVDEVALEIGDPIKAHDAIARLTGAGLVHRLDKFVFPTRPAVHYDRIYQ